MEENINEEDELDSYEWDDDFDDTRNYTTEEDDFIDNTDTNVDCCVGYKNWAYIQEENY